MILELSDRLTIDFSPTLMSQDTDLSKGDVARLSSCAKTKFMVS
jgi:hypothetical protein